MPKLYSLCAKVCCWLCGVRLGCGLDCFVGPAFSLCDGLGWVALKKLDPWTIMAICAYISKITYIHVCTHAGAATVLSVHSFVRHSPVCPLFPSAAPRRPIILQKTDKCAAGMNAGLVLGRPEERLASAAISTAFLTLTS